MRRGFAERHLAAPNGACQRLIHRAHAASTLTLRGQETIEIRGLEQRPNLVRAEDDVLNQHSSAADPAQASIADGGTERRSERAAQMRIAIEPALTDENAQCIHRRGCDDGDDYQAPTG